MGREKSLRGRGTSINGRDNVPGEERWRQEVREVSAEGVRCAWEGDMEQGSGRET